MVDEGKKRKASEIAEDADESVEETEAPAPQPRRRRTNGTDRGCGRSEVGGPEWAGLARDEVFEQALGFHWERSRIFTPGGWTGVESEYVRDITRCLAVVNAFDETRDAWGYRTANVAVVERYLRLFASAQSFELRILWMLLALEGMQLARVSFHRFDKLKGAMRAWLARECLERWTVEFGRIELCNDETLLEYIVAFLWTFVGQGSRRHERLLPIAGRLANSLSNIAGVLRQNHGRLDPWSIAADRRSRKYAVRIRGKVCFM
ncbi:hypothetical protein DYB30_011590 [Aphanomyces astaci]|uniref:Uncharacterized protein n=2 Tax=Aphanomyces astaci TaxID=112090 RepID=A0A397AK10_APHAT|nr:hypothetical protein DYB36_008592 [Aphanomyces astaci]RHY71349.1 hypothetical protein DYB30_011590 [Aphanomyces astaci]RHZ06399.1 hypothetical protein DYB26_014792 [Aphanomyces astaci]